MSLADLFMITKVSTTTVDFSNTGQTTLFTVDTGYLFIPLLAVIRAAGDCATDSSAGGTVITIGRSTDLDDFLNWQDLSNLEASGDIAILHPPHPDEVDSSGDKGLPPKQKSYAAGQAIQIDVVYADGVAGNKVDLFGYLVDV